MSPNPTAQCSPTPHGCGAPWMGGDGSGPSKSPWHFLLHLGGKIVRGALQCASGAIGLHHVLADGAKVVARKIATRAASRLIPGVDVAVMAMGCVTSLKLLPPTVNFDD